jgi:hypothetical protein
MTAEPRRRPAARDMPEAEPAIPSLAREGVHGLPSSEARDDGRLQGFSPRTRRRGSGEPCRAATQDVAMSRAYQKCTRDVPACCMIRRLEMPICRHFFEAL